MPSLHFKTRPKFFWGIQAAKIFLRPSNSAYYIKTPQLKNRGITKTKVRFRSSAAVDDKGEQKG
jgi:hypothetical protein